MPLRSATFAFSIPSNVRAIGLILDGFARDSELLRLSSTRRLAMDLLGQIADELVQCTPVDEWGWDNPMRRPGELPL